MVSREQEIELKCILCKTLYSKPKTLGCLHSFCLECLEIYVERNHSNIQLKCPICRTPFQIQQNQKQQLSNLPTDSYLQNALNIHNSLANSISQQQQQNKKKQKLMCLDEKNEATCYCLNCQDYFCETCTHVHQKANISKNHQLIPIDKMEDQNQINLIANSNHQIYCQIHQQEEIKLFCEDCNLSICPLCVDQHSSHKISTLSSVLEFEKKSLIDSINQVSFLLIIFFSFLFFVFPFILFSIFFLSHDENISINSKIKIKKLKPREKELKEGINKCEEIIKELEINSTITQTQIKESFNKIRIKLEEKEQELLNKLDEIEKYKKKELEIQKEELKFGIESIIGSCQMIQHSLSLSNNNNNNTKNDIQLLSMKNLYHSRLDYLSNNNWKIEPCHNPFIDFFSSKKEEESIYSSISNIGIIDSNEISTDKCLILRNQNQKVYKNREFKFPIISYSKEGNIMRRGGNVNKFEIKIEEESKLNNKNQSNNEWKIKDLKNGMYEVKMELKDEGKYLIFVQFNGIDIKSSPFQVEVFSKLKQRNYHEVNHPKLTFGSKGNKKGQFDGPSGITINSNGNIYVCDTSNSRIQIFDSEGNFISTFGLEGNENGQFSCPFGITINSKGNIIVSDTYNHRIQIFDSEGNFILTFGTKGKGNGQFHRPLGLAIDSSDNILICDNENNRIQIFDSEGNFISRFGSKGDKNGQFNYPFGITINSKGNIIVSDTYNHRIQIFDSKGNFISRFGSNGIGNGQFGNAYGVCVDLNENILVCDYINRIQIFNSEGEYMTQFKVKYPTNITIDPTTQNIIVCSDEHKISIY